jgi:hypothetical protein
VVCPERENPASSEICAVIRFLHAKNMSAAEIHLELCTVYGQNVMSERTLRQWCGMFKDGQTNVHDEERSDRPSVVSEGLVQSVHQKFVKDCPSQFKEFRVNFTNFHALYSTRLSQLG